jgi:hypothetical protein
VSSKFNPEIEARRRYFNPKFKTVAESREYNERFRLTPEENLIRMKDQVKLLRIPDSLKASARK